MLTLTVNIQPVRASGTVYIRADGSVDPPGAPVQRNGEVYTLTDNISSDGDGIQIARNNTVLDGAGFTIHASLTEIGSGINLNQEGNVTIRNINIGGFYGIHLHDGTSNVTIQNTTIGISGSGSAAIWLSWSSHITVSGNTIAAGGDFGIWLDGSSNNSITGNTIADKWLCIYLTDSPNNYISGNTIANNDGDGIVIYYSSNNIISGNIIKSNSLGIHLDSSSNYNIIRGNKLTDSGFYVWDCYSNIVENNTVNGKPLVYLEDVADQSVEDAGQVVLVKCDQIRVENLNLSRTSDGIELWETDDSIVSGNNITANSNGIMLYSSSDNSIVGNNITNNHSCGILLYYSSNSSIAGNNITANSIGILLYTSSDNAILGNNVANNSDGISLARYSSGSESNSISGNNITNNHSNGISLYYSSNNSISGNKLASNNHGILIYNWSSYNSISGNSIDHNGDGIVLFYSSSNTISGDNMTANSDSGIWLESSSDNRFYNNNIIDNSQQVHVYSSGFANVWDNGYPLGGNYWSDYNGTDVYSGPYQNQTGSDRIGDTPYVLDSANQDNYPLMNVCYPIPGDINCDGSVTLQDLVLLANAYGSTPQMPSKWNPNADINDNGKVDLSDLVILALHYGQHNP
jgi:parallel beta-helix repeat protein